MDSKSKDQKNNEPVLVGNIKVLKKTSRDSDVMCCSVLAKKNVMTIGWSDGVVEVRDTKTCNVVQELTGEGDSDPVTSLACISSIATDPLFLASYSSGFTRLWNALNGECLWSVKDDRQTLTNSFNSDYSWFAVSGSDAKIHIYDVSRQQIVNVLQKSDDPDVMDGHTMRVFCVCFHPSNKHELISGGWDNNVQFWDAREPLSKRKIRGPHICGEGIEFISDNEFLTASWTKHKFLQLWDYRSMKLIENIVPDTFTSFLYCCHYVPSGPYVLVGGSNGNMLRVIDTSTWITSASYRGLPNAIHFAKELPSNQEDDLLHTICVGFGKNCYFMEISA